MGTRRLDTVSDCIGQDLDLEARCPCGRRETIDPQPFYLTLIRAKKPTKLRELEQLMKCKKCGKRECKLQPVPRF
jgi:hypothetical protein